MVGLNKKKILLVDDDKSLRMVLSDKLKLSGFEVIEAVNGQEGLEKAEGLHPDLILLDILMPVMNGWEMLKRLREGDEWSKAVKVVMLTGVGGAESVAKAVEDGSFMYLVKTDQSIDGIVNKIAGMLESG